jgi:hypothetical protein
MKNNKKISEKEIEKKLNETIDFLEKASPEEVYKYFEEKNEFYFDLKSKTMQNLLKKKDKLINLALAKFSFDVDVSNYLYETSKDESIKLAAISNEKRLSPIYCFLGGMYNEKKLDLFLKKASLKELEIFFSSAKYNEFHIESFLEKKSPYDKIPQKKYNQILNYLEKNPNIKKKDTDEFEDGWGWYTNQKVSEKFKFIKLRNQ